MSFNDRVAHAAARFVALPQTGRERVFATPQDQQDYQRFVSRAATWDTVAMAVAPLVAIGTALGTGVALAHVDLPGVVEIGLVVVAVTLAFVLTAWGASWRFKIALRQARQVGWLVPVPAAHAYRAVLEAPQLLTELGAPDSARVAVAGLLDAARECAAELSRLAGSKPDADPAWLCTSPAYQTLVQVGAQAQALVEMAQDRRALITLQPSSTLDTATRAAREMSEEIDTARAALAGAATTSN